MALTPQQIVDLVNRGKGSAGMYDGATVANGLSQRHDAIADRMLRLQGKMSQYWEGDSAGQAYAGAGPLVDASKVSGQHLEQANQLYTGQGNSFKDLDGKIKSVGNIGDRPADDWVSNTPLSFLSNRSHDIEEWDKKARVVTEGYGLYHGQSTDNSGRWADPSQYGDLAMPSAGGDFSVTQPGGTGTGHLPSAYTPGGTGGTGSTGGSHAGGYSGGTANLPGPGAGTHTGSASNGNGPVPQQGWLEPGAPQFHGKVPDTTTSSGYTPPGTTPDHGAWTPTGGPASGSNTVSGNSFGPGGSGPGGFGPGGFGPGGFGPGGTGGYSGGSGSGSGSSGGRGYNGAGSNGNSLGRGTGAGSGTGAGAGALGNTEPASGRAAGAAGTQGRAGSPGMGSGGMGRGGKAEDDTEHKRADYLLETDPDDALVGTLPKTAPPVIGL
ncbi:hypothetical protein [Amycolatopsis sulphurea]|nr:hypothetical protein [Amycolatopsis sulphurea]